MPFPDHACDKLNYGQVTTSTAATLVVPRNGMRRSVIVTNLDLVIDQFIGDASVTNTTGQLIGARSSISFSRYIGPLYVASASGTPKVSWQEETG